MAARELLGAPRCTTSVDAGGYYCGHVFFSLVHLVRLSRTAEGHVRAGFLHVPREPSGAAALPPVERFAALRVVLDAALRGAAAEMSAAKVSPRLLISGFGPFSDVADNITGAFVAHPEATAALRAAHPTLDLAFCALPVDDRALRPGGTRSLAHALSAHRAEAAIAMGVARRRTAFTVETVPADDGLVREGPLRHQRGQPPRTRGPTSPWLADCVVRGADR